MAGWGEDVVNAMRQRSRERELEPVREGYQAAAEVSIGVLSKVLDRIEAKVEAGEKLSPEEKALRSELHAIKSRIEQNLKEFWQNNYGF